MQIHNDMENEVNVEYILTNLNHVPHAIRESDVLKFVDEKYVNNIFDLLGKDSRFLILRNNFETYYVSCETIFSKFLSLNLYLSTIKLFYLTKQYLIEYLSLVLNTPLISQVPEGIIIFAQKLNLVDYSQDNNLVKFPFSALLHQILKTGYLTTINKVLYEISDSGYLSIKDNNIDSYLKEAFSHVEDRVSCIIINREGFFEKKKQTLEQLGKKFKITRERVRQLQKKFLNNDIHRNNMLSAIVKDFIMKNFSLLLEKSSKTNVIVYLLNFFNIKANDFSFNKYIILGHGKKTIKLLQESFGREPVINSLIETNDLYLPQLEVKKLLKLEEEHSIYKEKKYHKVFRALLAIGKPAHYSEVFEKYLEMFSNDSISERSVHAILCRKKIGFVWVGIKGTYGVEDWGVHRPTNTLHNEVYEIVNVIYRKTNRPVSLSTIMTELTKLRKFINNNSLLMAASLNPRLSPTGKNHFIPKNNKVRSISQENLFEENFEDNLNSVLENFNK